MRGTWAVMVAALLVGCGEDESGTSAPPPERPAEPEPSSHTEEEAEPSTVAEPAEPEAAAPPSTTPSMQIVGADRGHLLFLDVGRTPWEVERVPSAPVDALHAVTWMGCGDRAAARSAREVGVWERGGALVGRRALPDVVRTLGERLTRRIEEVAEDYDVAPSPDRVIGVGALVRGEDGALAMRPSWSMEPFHAEMENCVGQAEEGLSVPLPIDGVEPRACAPYREVGVSLTHALEEAPPFGFECAYLFSDDLEDADVEWLHLGVEVETIVRAIPEEGFCPSEPPEDPFERFRQCTVAGDTGGLTVCKHPDDARLFVAVLESESMGCDTGPRLYVLRGSRVVAATGERAELRVMWGGGLWIYGGRRAWYVDGPGRRPLRFGRARPDAVLRTP